MLKTNNEILGRKYTLTGFRQELLMSTVAEVHLCVPCAETKGERRNRKTKRQEQNEEIFFVNFFQKNQSFAWQNLYWPTMGENTPRLE